MDDKKEKPKAEFFFGDPCPPIQSWIFPLDPKEKPHPIGEKKDDPSQPS